MCDPKFRTPGMARSSLLARSVMRRIASIDVPGFSTQCIRKSYSRKFGQKLLAEKRHGRERGDHQAGQDGRRRGPGDRPVAAVSADTSPSAATTSADSFASSVFGRSSSDIAGVTVSATSNDDRIAST